VARAVPAALLICTLVLSVGAAAGRSTACAGTLGALAYVEQPKVKWPRPERDGSLRVLELRTCRVRVLVPKGVQAPVRWSHDGRWIAFGEGGVVRASGGRILRPLGTIRSWAWAPRKDVLAGVTRGGGVVAGGPGTKLRRLLRDGSRADNLAFDRSGRRVAVGRDRPSEVALIDLGSGRSTVVRRFSPWYAGVTVARWSPDNRWLLFWGPYAGASIAADGVALHAVPALGGRLATLANGTLVYDDFLSWCGRSRLVVSAGFDRASTSGKTLISIAAPRWRATKLARGHALSWVTPACSPDGSTIAAAAGRNFSEPRFGLEHRSIWLLPAAGGQARRLTVAPANATDEQPLWSHDGRSLLFVRTRGFVGTLYLVRPDGRVVAQLAKLGWSAPYYGHYDWAKRLDWYQPR
jgi:Tol biopolymer transport system component